MGFLHLGEGLPLGLSFGWVSQLCVFLREGRQNPFDCSLLSNHVEVNNFYFMSVCLFRFYLVYKASNSVTYLVITVNTLCLFDEDISFLLLILVFL